MRCPACSAEVPTDSRFCGGCGNDLERESTPTQTSADFRTSTSAPSLDDARFLPGTMVSDRYRIIGLLGKGGMGEVYRADDLKLGQPVALKFLPAELSNDPGRLERFLNEVKIARQVAHPNVCRVYDVGEAEGHHYLSMEYVDGEDLSTLLRRIGRLPEDKAVQIARQLCAGLAAAHDLGILHRDIKPANVMLDGRGRSKLTDFGLAVLAAGFQGAEVRAGTPTYMAPEQIEGTEVSVRSDIYSLGLVLYELFTGKPAFDAGSMIELKRQQLETIPTSPSSLITTLDPTVERVILQCLNKDPAQRPPTALAVAAALPGGDPLAAALAAGETPSPEMVAAAGPQGGLRPLVATALLVAVVLVWIFNIFPTKSSNPYDHLQWRKPYAALKDNAREIATSLGYDDAPGYTWAGFGWDMDEYLLLIREFGPSEVGEHLAQPGQSVVWMDYRQRAGPLVPLGLTGRVSWGSPPPGSGEVAMEVDLLGRLNFLRVTPRRKPTEQAPEETPEVDWAGVFELAGLDITEFESAAPTVRPESFADDRQAWTGILADYKDRDVRIEAASLDGKPIYFAKIISSDSLWTAASGQPQAQTGGVAVLVAALIMVVIIGLLLLAGALFLAYRNLKLGRGDRQGAFRLAAFIFSTRMLYWILAGDHIGHPAELLPLIVAICAATTLGLLAWIVYVACEPYLRRLWPETMVSWTRVLAGRLRDPLVGRDVLIGCTFGMAIQLFGTVTFWIGSKAGLFGVLPYQQHEILLRGGRYAVGQLFSSFLTSTVVALVIMMLFLLLRMICRKTVIAVIVFCILGGVFGALQLVGLFGVSAAPIAIVLQVSSFALFIFVLLRFGLLAQVVMTIFSTLQGLSLLTLDTSAPFFSLGLFVTAVAFAMAAYGWHTSLAGRSLMQDSLLKTGS